MRTFVIHRIAMLIPLSLGVATLVFAMMHMVPGDPATVLLGQDATPEAVEQLRENLGLNQPITTQFGRYLGRLARGDLGESIFRHESVTSAVLSRLPATVEIAIAALMIAVLVGVPLGVWAAVRQGSLPDVIGMLLAHLGVSMPVFWVGILLMLLLAVQWSVLPAIGRGEPLLAALGSALTGRPTVLLDTLRHLALPALTLGLASAALISRVVRASMLDTLHAKFVIAASAKGLPGLRVTFGHALRNALLPVINLTGLRFGELLGGAVLTESIFGWPGLGQLMVTAISQRDIPLVQGTVLIFALLFAVVNLLVDLLGAAIDPRARIT